MNLYVCIYYYIYYIYTYIYSYAFLFIFVYIISEIDVCILFLVLHILKEKEIEKKCNGKIIHIIYICMYISSILSYKRLYFYNYFFIK